MGNQKTSLFPLPGFGNGTDLVEMLEAKDARSDPTALEILRDSRRLCSKCERELVLRMASNGPAAGKPFWGYSAFLRCQFTVPLSNDHSKAATPRLT